MKHIILNGGLGNQLFQITEALKLKDMGVEVCLDASVVCRNWFQKYILRQRPVEPYYKYFTLSSDIVIVEQRKTLFYVFFSKVLSALSGNYVSLISEDTSGKHKYHMGYWQNIDVAKRYSNSFIFDNDRFPKINTPMGSEISSSNSLAVHIRRGDYLLEKNSYFAKCSLEYYKNALALFAKVSIFVFSDDIEWVKKSGLFSENVTYVTHNGQGNSHMDMYLMSRAKNIILCNSTFSVWGALLGEKDKVVAPRHYYSNKENHLALSDWVILEN